MDSDSDTATNAMLPVLAVRFTYAVYECLLWASHAVLGQLQPLGTTTPPFSSAPSRIAQLAYDLSNGTLYYADSAQNIIGAVTQLETVPLVPPNAAPWGFSIVAGQRNGSVAAGSVVEMMPMAATFNAPSGLLGWPTYGADPYAVVTPTSSQWAGLWVSEYSGYTVRFIHFRRGNNITVVAGNGTRGFTDGVGAFARLHSPFYLAWGRFPTAVINGRPRDLSWTSVLVWSEHLGGCLRQGIPTTPGGPVSAVPNSSTVPSLQGMSLNVSSFVGLCGVVGSGEVGLAFQQPVLGLPAGIAFLNAFPWLANISGSSGSEVLLVADGASHRLSMISPLFPLEQRFLTVVFTNILNIGGGGSSTEMYGITVASVLHGGALPSSSPDVYTSSVQVFLSNESSCVTNVTLSLRYQGSSVQLLSTTDGPLVTALTVNTSHAAVVRFAPNASFTVALVVFVGTSSDSVSPFQFFCCLDADYLTPISVQSNGYRRTGTPTGSHHPSKSPTFVRRVMRLGGKQSITVTATEELFYDPYTGLMSTAAAIAAGCAVMSSGAAFASTGAALNLQKLNGVLASQHCSADIMTVLPSTPTNPLKLSLGSGQPGYWRMSWVWVQGLQMMAMLGNAVVSVITANLDAANEEKKQKEKEEKEKAKKVKEEKAHRIKLLRAAQARQDLPRVVQIGDDDDDAPAQSPPATNATAPVPEVVLRGEQDVSPAASAPDDGRAAPNQLAQPTAPIVATAAVEKDVYYDAL